VEITHSMNPYFMFATGIEGSCPTIHGGRTRVDQLAKSRHYDLWKTDFDRVEELGITFLRYGPPIHRTFVGPDEHDWDFADLAFADLFRRDIAPIVDLCHFGVPDWIGGFQNPDFPRLFANYARAFAERFPWVQLYTPVNEMYVCALFSGRYGWWNEQQSSDCGFVTALKHLVKANVLASREILAGCAANLPGPCRSRIGRRSPCRISARRARSRGLECGQARADRPARSRW
jgi:beta-glucosidase/6-phospho-beta-glucosidase/beta-galactosidase